MISQTMSKRIATCSLMALLCAVASAQSTMNSVRNDSPTTGLSSNLSGWTADMTDTQFARKAMEANLTEVQLGNLAIEKGSSDVKKIGQMMVQDHQELFDQLKPVASKIGVAAPATLSADDRALLASLKAKSGQQFDDAYIEAVMDRHRADVVAFGNEARIGKDQALINVAANGAKIIGEHRQAIEQLARNRNVPIPGPIAGSPGVQP